LRRRVIERVHGRAIRAGNQVTVRVDGDLDRRERVPEIVDADLPEFCLLEHPLLLDEREKVYDMRFRQLRPRALTARC